LYERRGVEEKVLGPIKLRKGRKTGDKVKEKKENFSFPLKRRQTNERVRVFLGGGGWN